MSESQEDKDSSPVPAVDVNQDPNSAVEVEAANGEGDEEAPNSQGEAKAPNGEGDEEALLESQGDEEAVNSDDCATPLPTSQRAFQQNSKRSFMKRRGSQKSIDMYGPKESSRLGRPSVILCALDDRMSQLNLMDLEDGGSTDSADLGEPQEDLLSPLPGVGIMANAPKNEFDPDDSPRKRRQMLRRVSLVAGKKDRSHFVQVKARDVSYHVAVQADAHHKETVLNQSICYFTYEFFARLRNLICRSGSGDENTPGNIERYEARGISDLFLPFTKKTILKNINLVLSPGKSYLVLGPPQSGKTTLLKAIAGKLPDHRGIEGTPMKNKPHRSGRLEYNCIAPEDDKGLVLPNVVSYVGQLDIHAPYMTVKETFDFAANSRNGDREKLDKENLTIQGLGLGHVQDTFVGNSDVRGVSGGQRRRVTIGEMMQAHYPVACADEVSTGLDAAVTFDICRSIVDYARAEQTTRVVSLLQPGPETFSLFDEVIVLSEGYLVYCGPTRDVENYFTELGYPLPACVDMADFLQSVTTVDGELLFDDSKSPYDHHLTSAEFANAFGESRFGKAIQLNLEHESAYAWKDKDESERIKIPECFLEQFPNRWTTNFKLNFNRHLLLWWRDKGFIIGKTFENIGMAVATGGILFGQARLPNSVDVSSDDWNGEAAGELQEVIDGVFSALFMTLLHITLGTTTTTPDDLDGRPIHYKHSDAGFYQTTAFAIGRILSTLPQRAIEIVAFGIPVYWMVGLHYNFITFLVYLLIVLSYTFGLKIMYGIIAQLLPNKQNVLSFGTFLVLLFSLFGGFIVYPGEIPGYFKWLWYINPMGWALQAMLINEFTSDKYGADNVVAETILGTRGFETDTVWIGYTFAYLFPFTISMLMLLSCVLKSIRIEPKTAGTGEAYDEPDEIRSDFNLPFVPVDLSFENMSYTVKNSQGDGELRLLNDISGLFKAGRLVALMGSSGAGKTTLMDVVAIRKQSGQIEGEVCLNGFPQERVSFLRSSGYVEQFDIQQAELTVRETVVFSALLRLSREVKETSTEEGRLKFVDYVLDMMELTNIQNVPVGSYEEGGLSFEQRKRLAIAVELAASPSVLFLDEPTSGLDARGALVIMRALKRIGDTGRTVCCTIHQPSAAVFEMFDDLILLKRGGEVVFFGELGAESTHLVNYFEQRGAVPIKHGENPAAWMLRVYTSEGDQTDWKGRFEESDQFIQLQKDIASIKANTDDSKRIAYDNVFATSTGTQHMLMLRRVFTIMMRSPSYNLARLMIAIFYALLLGTVFLRSQPENRAKQFRQYQVDGILSTIFLGLIIIGVVSISMAVPVMKQIRDVFYKHRASGMLSHNSITVAVTIAEIPYLLLISAIFSAVYYSLVGLFDGVEKWFTFFLYFALNIGTYTYFGQAFICLVKDIPTAGALVGALIGYNVFFSGLVVRPQYFSGPFQLGYWSAPGRYAFEGIVVSQFKGLDITVVAEPNTPWWFDLNCDDMQSVDPCSGTMEEYVDFFFGGRFKEQYQPLDTGVLVFCLLLARLLLWVALWKFNYVNT